MFVLVFRQIVFVYCIVWDILGVKTTPSSENETHLNSSSMAGGSQKMSAKFQGVPRKIQRGHFELSAMKERKKHALSCEYYTYSSFSTGIILLGLACV